MLIALQGSHQVFISVLLVGSPGLGPSPLRCLVLTIHGHQAFSDRGPQGSWTPAPPEGPGAQVPLSEQRQNPPEGHEEPTVQRKALA